MRKLYLIRHASPDFKDGVKLCIGRTDIDIGDTGIAESKILRDFFATKDISCIYSSPLRRCISTSKIISNGNIEIKIDPGLIEIDMGEWEGIPLKNIVKELGDEPLEGEIRVKALDRMEKTLLNIMNNSKGDIICLAHAGVNCAFVARVTGSDIRTSRSIKQPYASYNSFEFDNGEFRCLEIGVVPKGSLV